MTPISNPIKKRSQRCGMGTFGVRDYKVRYLIIARKTHVVIKAHIVTGGTQKERQDEGFSRLGRAVLDDGAEAGNGRFSFGCS
jgi:hypothetical protein